MAGKGALPFDHPQALGAIGVTGAPGPNRLAREADVVIAIGIAAERLHHRLEDRVPASVGALHHHQRHRVRRRQAPGAAAGRRRARRRSRNGCRCSTDGGPRERVSAARARGEGGVGAGGRSRSTRIDAPVLGQGAVIGVLRRGHDAERHHPERRRQPARRSAQAVAGARSEAVSPRVRLLVHGLRDCRRPRRAAWPRPIARCSCWSATART